MPDGAPDDVRPHQRGAEQGEPDRDLQVQVLAGHLGAHEDAAAGQRDGERSRPVDAAGRRELLFPADCGPRLHLRESIENVEKSANVRLH